MREEGRFGSFRPEMSVCRPRAGGGGEGKGSDGIDNAECVGSR